MWYNMRCSREHKKHKDKDWNMNGFTSIEDAREYFSKDRFATDNAITLEELDEEHSMCSMQIGSGHRNAYGGVMKPQKPAATNGKDLSQFTVGKKVKHPKFGVGTIVGSRGAGNNMIIDFAFDGLWI